MKILSFYISNYFFLKQTNYTIFTYYSQSFFPLLLLCCTFQHVKTAKNQGKM